MFKIHLLADNKVLELTENTTPSRGGQSSSY